MNIFLFNVNDINIMETIFYLSATTLGTMLMYKAYYLIRLKYDKKLANKYGISINRPMNRLEKKTFWKNVKGG